MHRYTAAGESPVLRVVVSKAEKMTGDVTKYEFRALDGSDLPAWEAGAHLDIVVAPEFLRQYSMSGDPADRSVYQIGVLREDAGRGGSKLLHRIFSEGRKIFISRPINHFPLDETARGKVLPDGRRHRHHADDRHGAPAACARPRTSNCITRSSRARPAAISPTWPPRHGRTGCICTSLRKAAAPISTRCCQVIAPAGMSIPAGPTAT
jgi:hypothetical protein